MSDKDRLDAFATEIRSRVVPPDFDALAAVGRRRRRVAVSAAGVAAVAVLVAGFGVKSVFGNDATPLPPVHTAPVTTGPTTTGHPPAGGSRADRIVDSPKAFRASTAVLPDHPNAIASVWTLAGKGEALAVTGDDYVHRTTLMLGRGYPKVSAAGPDWFFVGQPDGDLLVSASGHVEQVLDLDTPGPIEEGEYLVQRGSGTASAVNPTTGTAHPVTLPTHSSGYAYGDRDLLWTIATVANRAEFAHSSVEWSTDGGSTWSSHELPSGPLAFFDAVPSAPGTMAVTLVGDGNTIPPLDRLVVSHDAGAGWQSFDEHGHYAVGVSWTAALPDRRLLVDALDFTRIVGGHAVSPRGVPGLVTSKGSNWAALSFVHPSLPPGERDPGFAVSDFATTAMNDGTMDIYAQDYGNRANLLMSNDGGRSWSRIRGR